MRPKLRNVIVPKHIVQFPFMLGFLFGKQNKHKLHMNIVLHLNVTLCLLLAYIIYCSSFTVRDIESV